MNHREWKLREADEQLVQVLSQQTGLHPVVTRLLCARGLRSAEQIAAFLNNKEQPLTDPFLLQDMDKACARIERAIVEKQSILVYGDYDADGVTATALLLDYLRGRGARCGYFIPDRSGEGYGLHCGLLEQYRRDGIDLVVTVDCGVTAVEEVAFANEIGLDIVITDHHECAPTLPPAIAVVNPKRPNSTYPFCELAGVGVVFKLLCALEGPDGFERLCEQMLDLVAIGTIADVMPLTGENRILVSRGLAQINRCPRPSVRALIAVCGLNNEKKVTASTVGYTLAPRINAAGRVGCAGRAVELFLTDDPVLATELAEELCEENRRRQQLENEMMQEAIQMLDRQGYDTAARHSIVLWKEGWHQGVIGIVASRLSDRFRCPVILISVEGEAGKGSGRSTEDFNLFAALERCSGLLQKFGGHALAAGINLRIEQIPAFAAAFCSDADQHIAGLPSENILWVDAVASLETLDVDLVRQIQCMEPFGSGNPMPLIAVPNVLLRDVLAISNDRHQRLTLQQGDLTLTAFMFGVGPDQFCFAAGDRIDVVGTLDLNYYKGVFRPQMAVRELRLCMEQQHKIDRMVALYERFAAGEELSEEQAILALPERETFVSVFRYIKQHSMDYDFSEMEFTFCRKVARHSCSAINECQLRVCLDVLEEFGLAQINRADGRVYVVLQDNDRKVNLNDSTILRQIRKMRDRD